MNKALQALLAVTCVVALLVGVLWLRDREQQQAAIEAEKIARTEAIMANADALARQRVAECETDLEAYDRGNVVAFVVRANGGDMLEQVNLCRKTVARGY